MDDYGNLYLGIEAQGSLLKCSVRGFKNTSLSSCKRGKVIEFSKKSRKRLLDLMHRLGLDKTDKILFITLTYAKDFPSAAVAKQNLRAFLKRLKRINPKVSAIWRIELQDRGAPHFHLIIFNMPFIDKTKVKEMWGSVIDLKYWDYTNGEAREPFTRVEKIGSLKKLINYVSKYVAKLDDTPSRSDPANSAEGTGGADTGGLGFNTSPYLAESIKNIGRHWGYFNKINIKLAVLYYSEMKIGIWYNNFHKLSCRYWDKIKDLYQGFTIFNEDAYMLFELAKIFQKSEDHYGKNFMQIEYPTKSIGYSISEKDAIQMGVAI